jgi:DNA-binding response OmpR family regulator
MSSSIANCKILIVEDDNLIAGSLKETLARNGFNEIGMADGEDQAMRLTAELQPDIAIVDIRLRSGDGLKVADFARRSYATRVIFASGYIDEHLAALPGDSLFVRKPYDHGLIVEAVVALCRGRDRHEVALPAGIQSAAQPRGPRPRSG